MIPVLYDVSESSWTDNGLGLLRDAGTCTVTEEANGLYELQLTLPATSPRYADLQRGRQILAKPNQTDRAQPFRIYRISRPIRGMVTVDARHVSYDLSGVVVSGYSANNAAAAVAGIDTHLLSSSPFLFSTDLVKNGDFKVETPSSVRQILGPADREGTLLQVFGGDLKFDRETVQLLADRGTDRGFRVAYGVNMTDLQAEENGGEVCSGVVPYWTDGTSLVIGDAQYAAGTFGWPAVKPVDLTSEFSEKPSKAMVEAHGAAYVVRNHVGEPKANFTVRFVPPGARGLQAPELLGLFDPVTVRYEAIGIEVKKRVVRTVWDVLRDRYLSVEIGDRAVFVAETIAAPAKAVAPGAVGGGGLSPQLQREMKDTKDTAGEAKDKATNAITAAATADSKADAAWNKASSAKDQADRAIGDLSDIINALSANTTYSGFRNAIKDKPV